jgi:hypothetical protein
MSSSAQLPIVGPRPVIEPYVDPDVAAEFLSVPRATLLDRARRGEVPAHPWSDDIRRMWRFRLSELAEYMDRQMAKAKREPVEHRRRRKGNAKAA